MFKANASYSVLKNQDLVTILSDAYDMRNVKSLHLYRANIGDVYFLKDNIQSYVMKIYRSNPLHKKNAQNSGAVMDYLGRKGISVPKVIKNNMNFTTTTILAPEGEREVLVTSFLNGETIEQCGSREFHEIIGKEAAQMRRVMKDYTSLDKLIKIDEDYIINNFIKVMNKYFPHKKEEIDFLKKYGEILSQKIKELYVKQPLGIGFCHGDFHNGNMIKTSKDRIEFFDFDACGIGCNMLDISVYCDRTDYFNLDKTKILETQETLELYLQGYTSLFPLTQLEIESIPLFTALRHYELNAIIPINRAPIEGDYWLNDGWIDAQYAWLKAWYGIYHA